MILVVELSDVMILGFCERTDFLINYLLSFLVILWEYTKCKPKLSYVVATNTVMVKTYTNLKSKTNSAQFILEFTRET